MQPLRPTVDEMKKRHMHRKPIETCCTPNSLSFRSSEGAGDLVAHGAHPRRCQRPPGSDEGDHAPNVKQGLIDASHVYCRDSNMGVSKNRGTPKSSILIGFSIINHPF